VINKIARNGDFCFLRSWLFRYAVPWIWNIAIELIRVQAVHDSVCSGSTARARAARRVADRYNDHEAILNVGGVRANGARFYITREQCADEIRLDRESYFVQVDKVRVSVDQICEFGREQSSDTARPHHKRFQNSKTQLLAKFKPLKRRLG
jgi:hypothetical protein